MRATTTADAANVTLELGQPERSPAVPVQKPNAIKPLLVFMLALLAIVVSGSAIGLVVVLWLRVADLEMQIQTFTEAGALVTVGSGIPLVGGSAKLNVTTSLLAGSGAWAPGVAMPNARSDLQAILCAGQVFVLGGLNLNNTVVDDVWSFDPIYETFKTSHTPMPTPRYRFGATCVDDSHIYVGGGFDSSAAGEVGTSLASVDVLDVITGTWSSAPALTVARGDLALAAIDGAVHALGGYDHDYAELSSHEVLASSATAWVSAASMPRAKGDVQAVTIGQKLYVPGGWNSESTFLDELVVYDASTDTWSTKAPMSAPRGDGAVVAYDGRVYVMGGEMWSGQTSTCDWGWGPVECAVNLIPMHGVEMYVPADDQWIQASPMPASRFRFAAAAVGERGAEGALYAFGGHMHGEVAVDSVWTFHDVPRANAYVHVQKAP